VGRFISRKDLVHSVQEAGWSPGTVWIRAEIFDNHRGSIPYRSALSKSLYRQSYSGTNRYVGHDRFKYDLKYDVLVCVFVCVCVRAVSNICGCSLERGSLYH